MLTCRRLMPRSSLGCCVLIAIITATHFGESCIGQTDTDPGDSDSSRAEREERLSAMRDRAKTFVVERVVNGERRSARLRSEPLFRYSDQPRGLLDATFWCWGSTGRPVALAKIESAVTVDKKPYWQYCVASLADGPVEFNFGNGRRFATKKPGITLRMLDGAPPAGNRPAARLRQMKELVARFSGTIHAIHLGSKDLQKQEMRLLTSPIHRYADDEAGIRDGVIFGLSTNGTNPDMHILIELREGQESAAEWHYGIVKMTYAEVHIRLDKSEVYSSAISAPLDTWTYFQIVEGN